MEEFSEYMDNLYINCLCMKLVMLFIEMVCKIVLGDGFSHPSFVLQMCAYLNKIKI
jgi:hypothetical protein